MSAIKVHADEFMWHMRAQSHTGFFEETYNPHTKSTSYAESHTWWTQQCREDNICSTSTCFALGHAKLQRLL